MFAVFSRARKALRAGAVLASGIIVGACDPALVGSIGPGGGGNSGPRINTDAPVPVALLIPKSDANAGQVAVSLEQAARLAVADLAPDVTIDLRVYDTAGSAATAAAQAQTAVNAGAKIILGPLFGEAANEVGKALVDDGVNVLSFSNNPSIAGGNVFVLGPTFRNTANRLVGYAKSQGKNSIVIAHPNNVEGNFGRVAIQSAAQRNGVAVSAVEGFEFTQQGVVNAIPRIRDSARAADALFLTSNSAGALPLLAQLLPEAGLSPTATQYVGLARWDVPAQTLTLPGLDGGWFALPNQVMMQNFSSRYHAAYGTTPHNLGGLAYDGIAAIGALVSAGNREALTASALTQPAGFQGVGGAFRLLQDGTNQRALAVARVTDNKVVIIDPAPRSFAGF